MADGELLQQLVHWSFLGRRNFSMPDAAGAVGPMLTALRALPVWVLGGLAVAGYAVLFLPAFGAITPVALDAFRANWGV